MEADKDEEGSLYHTPIVLPQHQQLHESNSYTAAQIKMWLVFDVKNKHAWLRMDLITLRDDGRGMINITQVELMGL